MCGCDAMTERWRWTGCWCSIWWAVWACCSCCGSLLGALRVNLRYRLRRQPACDPLAVRSDVRGRLVRLGVW